MTMMMVVHDDNFDSESGAFAVAIAIPGSLVVAILVDVAGSAVIIHENPKITNAQKTHKTYIYEYTWRGVAGDWGRDRMRQLFSEPTSNHRSHLAKIEDERVDMAGQLLGIWI